MQGPRLNLTKEHKRGVVYGPDHRLHWKVTTPMPRALVSSCTYEYTFRNNHNSVITVHNEVSTIAVLWCVCLSGVCEWCAW